MCGGYCYKDTSAAVKRKFVRGRTASEPKRGNEPPRQRTNLLANITRVDVNLVPRNHRAVGVTNAMPFNALPRVTDSIINMARS